MAHYQSASRSIRCSTKQKRQPEVSLRRSARLASSKQSNTASANPGVPDTIVNHETEQIKHLKSAPEGQKRGGEHHNLPSCKRRQISHQSPLTASNHGDLDPIDYWRRSGFHWPQTNWSKYKMDRYLPRKKSTAALRRKESQLETELDALKIDALATSDQQSREEKSAPYRSPQYEKILATKGSFMHRDPIGMKDTSKTFCRTLLETTQSVPSDTLFRDDVFDKIWDAIRNRNEARIIRDISPLLVPSVESLAILGEETLGVLIQSVNEGWNNSIPFTKTRPQPDFAVGFRYEAFSEDQLKKLEPFVGDTLTDLSLFLGTYYMYFPFFTCEIKCSATVLNIADRQNAHSATLAVRGVVELFRLVRREKEVDREILAFSISHDDHEVRIYGHYAVVGGKKDCFYRHLIHNFNFIALDGKDKWTTYQFTKNVYKVWMPMHFKRVCAAIDDIPADLGFGVSQSKLRYSENSDLSQRVDGQYLSDSNVATPNSPFTQSLGQKQKKKQNKK